MNGLEKNRKQKALDPTQQIELRLRDLRSPRLGLSEREAARRLARYGLNRLQRHSSCRWPKELVRQFTHPLALLLWAAAALAWAIGITPVAVAMLAARLLYVIEEALTMHLQLDKYPSFSLLNLASS